MSCGVGCHHGWDLALLWHWHRPGETALFGPLTWESPDAMDAALRSPKSVKNDGRIGSTSFPQCNFCISVPEKTHANRTSGEGVGWIGNLGGMDTKDWLWHGLAMRSCCVALGTCDGACSWERLECVHVCIPGSLCSTVAKPLSWGETPTNTTSELCMRIL